MTVNRRAVRYNKWAPAEDRFWDRVEKKETCWLWIGKKNEDGYGRLCVSGKIVLAHRFSYTMHNGVIPTGVKVLHTCDTPSCVNPEHLFLGTQLDNIMDMVAKGRNSAPRGEDHSRSVLSEESVKWCRENYKLRCRKNGFAALAIKFGVTEVAIRWAILGKTWKHVT